MTLRLAPRVRHLTAVEIDRDLACELASRLPSNAEIVTADILDFDFTTLLGAGPLRLAGNLPYNISSPILFKLLGLGLVDATLMLQREVADRLVAKPGTKDYGLLTIFNTAQADIQRVLTLPPGAFRPAPKVHSSVVRLRYKRSLVPERIRCTFEPMIRSVFTQRRKTLANALRPFAESAGFGALAVLEAAAIDPIRRPETLTVDEAVRLASALTPPKSQP